MDTLYHTERLEILLPALHDKLSHVLLFAELAAVESIK